MLSQAHQCDIASTILLAYNLYSVFVSHNLRVSLPKIFLTKSLFNVDLYFYNNECAHIVKHKYLDLDIFFFH